MSGRMASCGRRRRPTWRPIRRLISRGDPGSIVLGAGSVGIANLQAGMFTADVTGRAPFATGWLSLSLIGTGIFTANASGWAPFANGWLPLSLVGTGIFLATPAGRAPFAAGVINASLMQPDAYSYATGGGTGSAYTATFSPLLTSYVNNSSQQVFTTYWDGLRVVFKAVATCAAGATLNVDTLGVKPIYRKEGIAVIAGDIVLGSIVEVVYNASLNSGGGAWQLLTPPSPPQTRARDGDGVERDFHGDGVVHQSHAQHELRGGPDADGDVEQRVSSGLGDHREYHAIHRDDAKHDWAEFRIQLYRHGVQRISNISLQPLHLNELPGLAAAAAADRHGLIHPTHVVRKNGEMVGYASLGRCG